MDNNNLQKLAKTKLYIQELEENKASVKHLINFVKHQDKNNPQLEVLQARVEEINNQLNSLNEIKNKLENENQNDS